MLKEMPKKYWRNMPETSLVQPLIATARAREVEMIDRSVQREGLKHAVEAERRVAPKSNLRSSWEALMEEARGCTRCDLYKCGTQTVFGEGPLNAKLLFVGEQPGDQEDLAGRPFIGPAGQLFDEMLQKAGVDRSQTYVTNAVTMSRMHRLYGVTMIEKGVSRLVSVDLGGAETLLAAE
jgi:DNA polymerase